jgi:hypothetical protein
MVWALFVAAAMLLASVGSGFAAQKKDVTGKQIKAPPSATESVQKSPTVKPTMQMTAGSALDHRPRVTINSFKKKVEADPTMAMMTGPAGYTPPTSAEIDLGEEITLSWSISLHNTESLRTSISGVGNVNPGTARTASDGTPYYVGEKTLRPARTTTYTLTATARPTASNVSGTPTATKSFTVEVRKPVLDIVQPSVNANTLNVGLSVRNTGNADFRPTPLNVNYDVMGFGGRSNFSITNGSFTTARMGINQGQEVSLGSIDLSGFRDQLFAYQAMSIRVSVGANYVQPLEEASEMFRHNWDEHTITLNQGILDLLAPATSCEVRLNNYNAANPRIPRANDSYVHLTMMGMGGDPVPFSIPAERYRVRLTGRVTGHDYIDVVVLFLINEITSSNTGAGLLSIRDGKLGLHLEFPNAGGSEIKLGTLEDRNFDDGEVPDINLGAFSVDVRLTPCIRNNRISYSSIEVDVPAVSASLSGRFDGLNPLIRDYLSDYVTNEIRSQLNSMLGSPMVKTAIEEGLASALGMAGTMNYLVSVRGSGNSITVTYR